MKIVAALSGGVDSSVAAMLAQQGGAEVVGVTLALKHPDPAFSAVQRCSGLADLEAVRAVCAKLRIPHVVLDRFDDFRDKVLRPAALEYMAGRTPNPCCVCNEAVKFAVLLDYARQTGADKILTGHYARISGTRLRRGADPVKDQTYFLYRLSPAVLERTLFPLGGMTKEEVRALASERNLPTANRPDSQDACFMAEGECFGETLRRLFDLVPVPGKFLYHGKTVGSHNGIHQFTLGQRKGLRIALGTRSYISRIDPAGDITLETGETGLLCQKFSLRDVCGDIPSRGLVQIRYRSRPVDASYQDGIVLADAPLRAVTPGQSAVFYVGDTLYGGGFIHELYAL